MTSDTVDRLSGTKATVGELNHRELCALGVRLLKTRFGCCWAVREFVTHAQESPDCFGAKSCGEETYLLEAKISRADFLSDRKKRFRINPEKGIGMFRYFLAPAGLISVDELPEKWGLIEVHSRNKIRVVAGKPPKRYPGAAPEWAHVERNRWGETAIAHSLLRRMFAGEDVQKYR
ncbi:hypothetical protein [Marinimicrobium sp. ABcell2]|uniref:hypothetical protein n=1 Tax=Marinimicrobium sp. ABcell2 TaxID=3069751 RepID=UPI0027B00D43|nr:hypothetical protein [Marinimicrobium sp. ABcell2]MDQ2077549.1 hypothetical protein [Marinimicrobium sp. ABcell2]